MSHRVWLSYMSLVLPLPAAARGVGGGWGGGGTAGVRRTLLGQTVLQLWRTTPQQSTP